SVSAAREAALDHRSVKCHQATSLIEPGEQRRVVAVAHEYLGVSSYLRRVQERQQVHAAIAATGSDNASDRRIHPRAQKVLEPELRRSGEVLGPGKDVVGVHRLEPELAQLEDSGLELVTAKRAGGSHDGDAVARAQRARLEIRTQKPPFPPRPPGARRVREAYGGSGRPGDGAAAGRGNVPSRGDGAPAHPRSVARAASRLRPHERPPRALRTAAPASRRTSAPHRTPRRAPG